MTGKLIFMAVAYGVMLLGSLIVFLILRRRNKKRLERIEQRASSSAPHIEQGIFRPREGDEAPIVPIAWGPMTHRRRERRRAY